ncbi:hypothetical protein JG688_00017171 [Phytophthora aleatoria]|uniref:Uncharacterized protein n=1 Tax=Phytophthora aleatoria TaxID=2496075 RepID=A0A8J5I705_9STRA|nr:hypothetical protein JG688_00017171 [Phytophthora aleatoria]
MWQGLKVELLKVPPGVTSVCQPAVATWNGPLKRRLRAKWVELMQEQLLAKDSTKPFKLKPPTWLLMICNWVNSAYARLHHCRRIP